MATIIAVIGANFGDEGKGLITDYYANRLPTATVVRYNGGAQAGHTVVTPIGQRHIFGHFGAGTFCGNPTHLSKFFISNPVLFRKEYNELVTTELSTVSKVTVDPDSTVTTPFDMLINQMIEQQRAGSRHGSCGCGINETVERSKNDKLCIKVKDLNNPFKLHRILSILSDPDYFFERIKKEVGYVGSWPNIKLINAAATISNFQKDCEFFLRHIFMIKDTIILNQGRDLIFEGAQGLLLDQDMKDYWPHVTSSKTGLHNIMMLMKEARNDDRVIPIYVTRTYVTRHGAGPLPHEIPAENGFIDNTNITNPHQGKLRFGRLNLDFLSERIVKDITGHRIGEVGLAVTHCDQMELVPHIPSIKLCSDGPTRRHVVEFKP